MEIKVVPQSATEIFLEFVGVEVRGVPHRGWANFLVGPDGLQIATYPNGQSTLSARRMAGLLGPEATPAALKKISEVVLEAARQWQQGNGVAMVEAERKRLREAWEEASAARNKAQQALKEAIALDRETYKAWQDFEKNNSTTISHT